MLKFKALVAILACIAITQMVETVPVPKQLLRFQPITQEQYETVMAITEGKPVISEERLIESGIKNLQKFSTSPGVSWKALLNKAGLEEYQQNIPEDGEVAGYPLCVIKSSDLDSETFDDAQVEDKQKVTNSTNGEKKRPVVNCVVVVRQEKNKEEPAESEQSENAKETENPEKPEKSENAAEPETPSSSEIPEQPDTPEVPKKPHTSQAPMMTIKPVPPFYAYYGYNGQPNAAIAPIQYYPFYGNPAAYQYINYGYGYPYPVPTLPNQMQKPKKESSQTLMRMDVNALNYTQNRKVSPSQQYLRQGYPPGFPFQQYNPFINPSAYPNPQYPQPGFSVPYNLPGQQYSQVIPPQFPPQYQQQFPQQYPQQFPQQFPQQQQPFEQQQFPQQFPFPSPFPQQFPQDAPQKHSKNNTDKKHLDRV